MFQAEFDPTRSPRLLSHLTLDSIQETWIPISKTKTELLFEVFSQNYQRGSTPVTSNLPIDKLTEVFGSQGLTLARSCTDLRTVGLDQAAIRISGD